MGSALQRLEVLVIGLIVLIAGTVVAAVMLVQPASPATYVQTMPQPIATSAAIMQSTMAPATVATSAPAPTAAPRPSVEPARENPLPRLTALFIPKAIWPWLLPVGLIACALVARRLWRQRRMTYTNQNVGQLLATADATTRADNIRVMQNLAAQGLLTKELAAAAGIKLTQPHKRRALALLHVRLALPRFSLPRVTLPALRLPVVRLPKPRIPCRTQRPIRIALEPTSFTPLPAAATYSAPAAPASDLGVVSIEELVRPMLTETALCDTLVAQATVLPEGERETRAVVDGSADLWTAEDRALAVAALIAEIWFEAGASREVPIQSSIVALDTAGAPGSGQVVVMIDGHPDEADTLLDLPDQIVARRPRWRTVWRQERLEVVVTDDDQPPVGGPLIAPILAHGRGGKAIRFLPLAAWRHLGLYGGNALQSLHAALSSLLYAQPPSSMALAIIDRGEITPLYRSVAHLVPLPDSPRETIERLAQAIRRGAHGAVRPLVLVVVEPDDTMLNLVFRIAVRLQARPATLVHLIIVQEQLSSAGRELYAMLPALIVSGGRGSTALLPNQGAWPKRGEARLIGRGMRAEGRAITLDETAIAGLVADLRGQPGNLLPVLWDAPMPSSVLPLADMGTLDASTGTDESEELTNQDHTGSGEYADVAAQRRRIANAIVAQRQRLMDAPAALVPPPPANGMLNNSEGSSSAPVAVEQRTIEADAPEFEQVAPAIPLLDTPAAANITEAIELPAAEEQPTDAVPTVATEPLNAGASTDLEAVAAVPESTAGEPIMLELPIDSEEMVAPDDSPSATSAPPRSRGAALLRTARESGMTDVPLPSLTPHRGAGASSPPSAAAGAPAEVASSRPAEPLLIVEPDNGFPVGPAPLGRVAMAELMARMVATPAIVAGQANELGVTKNRLVDLLKGTQKAQAKELAEILMVWIDLAGLLVEPSKPGRLRHPRALSTANLAEIAARLSATPCPDTGTVRAMWSESNEGRN